MEETPIFFFFFNRPATFIFLQLECKIFLILRCLLDSVETACTGFRRSQQKKVRALDRVYLGDKLTTDIAYAAIAMSIFGCM
jgi:hypothetical protein